MTLVEERLYGDHRMDDIDLAAVERRALDELAAACDSAAAAAWRARYLGKKGEVTQLLRGVGALPADQRKQAGQMANRLRALLQEAFDRQRAVLETSSPAPSAAIDVTLPARPRRQGHLHPITLTLREIERAFRDMGFAVVEGPQVEWDEYNFERLRIPADHPARDMWDTLWIDYERDGRYPMLLRTHTSPMQIRYIERHRPPIRVIVPGTCYRYEATDATHEWMLTQVEGLVIDEGISFAHLKGTLEAFVHRLFGPDVEARFRCDYFPFVEPGAEVAIRWRDGRWIELLGAGMVHPEILAAAGYDSARYTGFAFGIGVERTAMLRYGIDDIRYFYDNALGFLEQF